MTSFFTPTYDTLKKQIVELDADRSTPSISLLKELIKKCNFLLKSDCPIQNKIGTYFMLTQLYGLCCKYFITQQDPVKARSSYDYALVCCEEAEKALLNEKENNKELDALFLKESNGFQISDPKDAKEMLTAYFQDKIEELEKHEEESFFRLAPK